MKRKFIAKLTGYTTESNPTEGGPFDCKGRQLLTVVDFLRGWAYKRDGNGDIIADLTIPASYVSVARDENDPWDLPDMTELTIPEIDKFYQRHIVFRCVDHGRDFVNQDCTRFDICAGPTQADANQAQFNVETLVIAELEIPA